ncbi:LysR family transcriptional regulator [Pseudomonas sp. XK-1]|uniref:LysR family transcriptional regulator n=1 Tax=Pseudomonas sp. XK-1 TaxID=3136019 RepID=UPI0031196D89
MTVKQLRAFLAVAQSLSFAQACERLHLSQPALSLAIKNLEESLGGQLLTRTTRSVRLTPEGETLLPIARRLLVDWDNTEELLRQHFTLQLGKVAVAAMPSFAGNRLPAALKAFRDAYPRVNVAVHDVINERVMEMVRERRVELGVAFEPAALDGLQFTPLYNDRFVAVVPASSELASRDALSWADLLGQPFIALQRPSAVRLLLEDSIAALHGKLPVAFESHQLATVGRMVAEGLGVSAVPSLCRGQMEELGARCLPLNEPQVERRVGLLHLAGHQLSSAAQAMADVLMAQALAFSDDRS